MLLKAGVWSSMEDNPLSWQPTHAGSSGVTQAAQTSAAGGGWGRHGAALLLEHTLLHVQEWSPVLWIGASLPGAGARASCWGKRTEREAAGEKVREKMEGEKGRIRAVAPPLPLSAKA